MKLKLLYEKDYFTFIFNGLSVFDKVLFPYTNHDMEILFNTIHTLIVLSEMDANLHIYVNYVMCYINRNKYVHKSNK